jgi:hypothetical protein
MEDTMSTLRDMETELFELISRFIRQKDEDTPFRLAEQEEEVNRLECTDPERLGMWIAGNDFPFLIETLTLSDAVFSEEYPGVRLSFDERKRFASALEDHCERCPRCGARRAFDLGWKAEVDRVLAENKEVIAQTIARSAGKK